MHAWVLLIAISCWSEPAYAIRFPDALACDHAMAGIMTVVAAVEQYANPWSACVPAAHAVDAMLAPRDCGYPG